MVTLMISTTNLGLPSIALVGVEPTFAGSGPAVLPIRRKSSESDFVIAIADARSLPLEESESKVRLWIGNSIL